MKVCVIGSGYVGLVAGACLAEFGNNVICVDNDIDKSEKLQKGIIPIYEPGLEDIILRNVKDKRLEFSSDLKKAVETSLVCIITVGTPQNDDGGANLEYVYETAKDISMSMNGYKLIVVKSTVPVGSCNQISDIIKQHTKEEFDVAAVPEFLKQGDAINDCLKPERVIIGTDSERAINLLKELYSPYIKSNIPVILMDTRSAEMTKYASNSFLALKISYANQIANICEKVGADIEKVRMGMSYDKRIGGEFLASGIGYGGSCFPKDVKALIKMAKDKGCDYNILQAADDTNKKQSYLFVQKILQRFDNNIKDKTIAVWGLSFKPKTNDMREAPSVKIIKQLLDEGAKIQVYDPKAADNAKKIFAETVIYSDCAYNALKNADCLLLITEWNEFLKPDFEKIKKIMKTPLIFDGRNQYNSEELSKLGFEHICIGKSLNNFF